MYRKNGPIKLEKEHEGCISSCALSNKGSMCVSAGYDLRLVLWDINFSKPKLTLRVSLVIFRTINELLVENILFKGHTDWITDTAISSNNNWLLSVSKDKEIRLWDIENCDSIKKVAEQNMNLGKKVVNVSIK